MKKIKIKHFNGSYSYDPDYVDFWTNEADDLGEIEGMREKLDSISKSVDELDSIIKKLKTVIRGVRA